MNPVAIALLIVIGVPLLAGVCMMAATGPADDNGKDE